MFWIVIGLLFILAVEVYADFFLQSRDMATQKSEDFNKLSEHVAILIGAIGIAAAIVFTLAWGGAAGILGGVFFAVINGIVHGIIDWNIWKVYKLVVYKRMQKKVLDRGIGASPDRLKHYLENFKLNKEYAEDSAFYNTIGVDRYLHVATIIVLYFWFV